MKKIFQKIMARKLLAGGLVFLLAGGGYLAYSTFFGGGDELRYAFAHARRGTLVVSVSGSGQVSASNEITLKPKVSSDVIEASVRAGDAVKAGAPLLRLDDREARRAVRDAETSLEAARIALAKLRKPAEALTLIQAENALTKAKEAEVTAAKDIIKAREDGTSAVAQAFLDLPEVMTGLEDVLLAETLGGNGQWNLDWYADAVKDHDENVLSHKEAARAALSVAHAAYDKNFADYKAVSRYADEAARIALLTETYDTTRLLAEAVKNASNLIQFYKDDLVERNLSPHSLAAVHLSTLAGFTGKTNTHLSALLSAGKVIETSRTSLAEAQRIINEKVENLAKVKAGAEVLDIASEEIAVKQREHALADAREKLADYTLRAPFDGQVGSVELVKGEAASAGSPALSVITRQKIADISLNEVDVSGVTLGAKAVLTFDALTELSLQSRVVEVAAVGNVSQGVVTYNVKIAFDSQDLRVKPGMSVTAEITTTEKTDALLVPAAAVKSGSGDYVEIVGDGGERNYLTASLGNVLLEKIPDRREVKTGLTNDAETEILEGLAEGEAVVTRVIPSEATNGESANRSGFFSPASRPRQIQDR